MSGCTQLDRVVFRLNRRSRTTLAVETPSGRLRAWVLRRPIETAAFTGALIASGSAATGEESVCGLTGQLHAPARPSDLVGEDPRDCHKYLQKRQRCRSSRDEGLP
jgi:hypothetical protein